MKIRTDFVTNSSSSSFTLDISIGLKNKKTIKYKANSGVGEGFETYYQLVATKSPRELGEAQSIEQLITMLKESIGEDGLYGEGPEAEENRVLNDNSAFIKKIRELNSMDDIAYIRMDGTLEGRNEAHWYRSYSYDMSSGIMNEDEEGADFLDEGTGGGLTFTEAYGNWVVIDGHRYFGTKKQVETEYRKHQDAYKEYQNQMREYLKESFYNYLNTVKKDFEYSDFLFGDVDIVFAGKSFCIDDSEFLDEIRNEIEQRGGKVYRDFRQNSDYFVVNLSAPDKYYFPLARTAIIRGKNLKVITEYQLWRAFQNENDSAFTETEQLEEKEKKLEAELRNRIDKVEKERRSRDIKEWKEGKVFDGQNDYQLSSDINSSSYFQTIREEASKYLNDDASITFAGKVYVLAGFSGRLKERLIDEIEKRGAHVHDKMIKKADYLVINMGMPDASKLKETIKWEEKGFPKFIISHSQLFKAFREIPPLPFEETIKQRQDAEMREKMKLEEKQKAQELELRAKEARMRQAEDRKRQRVQDMIDAQTRHDMLQAFRKEMQEKKEREIAERERIKQENKLEKLLKEKDRMEKEVALQEARANAAIRYAPGEEPELMHNRIQTLMAKLDEAYPDHMIVNLGKDHKKWAETITQLYRALGYADNVSFLEAYGFRVKYDKGGRPASLDPEAVIEELKRRYPDGTTLKMSKVMEENKDLPIKTLSNNATEIFGMGLGMYLKQIGLLK